jgi:GTPase SAR1 family protein
LKQIDQHADENIMRILVANKSDLPEQEVEPSEGQALAE